MGHTDEFSNKTVSERGELDHPRSDGGGDDTMSAIQAWVLSPRVLVLMALMFVITLFTRAAPFGPGLYWDLLAARDFSFGQALLAPERLMLWFQHSRVGLVGLQSLTHLVFMAIMIMLLARAGQAEEPLPGLVMTTMLGLGMVHLFDLRALLSALVMLMVLSVLRGTVLRDAVGGTLVIPFAIASLAGLQPLLLLLPVVTTVFLREGFRGSLIVCALGGTLLNPDMLLDLLKPQATPLSVRFALDSDLRAQTLLAGILLMPNLLALPAVCRRQLPLWFTYLVAGLLCLSDAVYLPQLIVIGAFLLLDHFEMQAVLTAWQRLFGVLLLACVLHLYLYLNPPVVVVPTLMAPSVEQVEGGLAGPAPATTTVYLTTPAFSLNIRVREGIRAKVLERLYHREEVRIRARQVAELAWKYPLLKIDPETVALWREQGRPLRARIPRHDELSLTPESGPLPDDMPDEVFDFPADVVGPQ